jgi:hypothetical protein
MLSASYIRTIAIRLTKQNLAHEEILTPDCTGLHQYFV